MRLPAITPQQQIHEASRQRHECWYQAYLEGRSIDYAVTPDSWVERQNYFSCNGRRFWVERGFRIRTSTNAAKTILTVRLERDPRPTVTPNSQPDHPVEDRAWRQPQGAR